MTKICINIFTGFIYGFEWALQFLYYWLIFYSFQLNKHNSEKIGKLINFQLIYFKYQRRLYYLIQTITKKNLKKLEQSKLFYIPTGR